MLDKKIEILPLELLENQVLDFRIIPFKKNDDGRLICYSDVDRDAREIQEIEIIIQRNISIECIPTQKFNELIDTHFLTSNTQQLYGEDPNDLLETIISAAHQLKSSDIHFEVGKKNTRVRFRRDGLLKEFFHINKDEYPVIINKIKIRANLDIAEKRLPQDGRISFVSNSGEECDIRISSLPTLHGEKLVLRILSSNLGHLTLENLGIGSDTLKLFKEKLKLNQGLILISGPTGSGKTTTLYTTLKYLNDHTKNIVTIEDPIEYTLDGINQVQLKENIGLTFPKALKTFLRQDPDIIMVGEIRDEETAQMAIRASLTGHLVFATLHTNSAWASVTRLKDMGIQDFLIMETLQLSVAQRLVRKLCGSCKKLTKGKPSILNDKDIHEHFVSSGCKKCHFTGYDGRTAIYEFLPMSNAFKKAFELDPNGEENFRNNNQYKTLKEHAIQKVKNGITSVEEIIPIISLK